MDTMQTQPMDPDQGMEGVEMAQESPGYKICIAVDGSGAITVGMDGEDQTQEGYQPVGDIRQALALAMQMYNSKGQGQQSSDASMAFEQAAGEPR